MVPPSPPPPLSVTLPACGVGGWYPIPLTLIPPPKQWRSAGSPWMGDENCGGELYLSHPPPPQHSSHSPSTDFSADRQCSRGGGGLGSGDGLPCHKLERWPTVIEGEGWGLGGMMRDGGKVVPCPHPTWIWRGQTNILGFERKGTLHRSWSIQTVPIIAVVECAEWN